MAAIADMLRLVRPFVRNCPDEVMTEWVVDAARDFCQKSRWLREVLTVPTTADVQTYALDATSGDEEVTGAYAAQYDSRPLIPASPEEGFRSAGTPSNWWFSPRQEIVLNPVPAMSSSNALLVRVLLQPRIGATTLNDQLLLRWDRAIADGAIWRLCSMPGAGWANPDRVQLHMELERNAMTEARTEADMEHRHFEFNTVGGL